METEPQTVINVPKVLVIDDEEGVRLILRRSIELLGVSVEVAGDGFEGIDKFRHMNNDITMILLDLNMPGKSGREALREIREISGNVEVLIMSGQSVEELSDEFSDNQNLDFIQKPFQLSSLRQKVTGIISENNYSNQSLSR